MRLQQHLNEAKVRITPQLNSILGKQLGSITIMTKEEVKDLTSLVVKVGDDDNVFDVGVSVAGKNKGDNYIRIKRKNGEYTSIAKELEGVLSSGGWKVVKSGKTDSNTWTVYFTKG